MSEYCEECEISDDMIATLKPQNKALIAHLRDYISLMDKMWPNQQDAVKLKAKALLADCSGGSQEPMRGTSNV